MMQILPKVIPINELKNTAKISQLCRESDVPIVVTRNGYGEMVLMSVALFEKTLAESHAPTPAPSGAPEISPARTLPAAPPSRPPYDDSDDEVSLLSAIYGE